jgi:hypothetical protein
VVQEGVNKMHPKAELALKVADIIDSPEKLIRYKNKHYKNRPDTGEIDTLIHQAKIAQKQIKSNKAEQESVAFDREIADMIKKARSHLRKERKKGSIKAKSLINACTVNCTKTVESFLYMYPIEGDRRKALVNKTDIYERTALFYA